jgi:hypothetical protein
MRKNFIKSAAFVLIFTLILAVCGAVYAHEGKKNGNISVNGDTTEAPTEDLYVPNPPGIESKSDCEMWIVKFKALAEFPGSEKQFYDEIKKVIEWGFLYIEGLDAYIGYVDDFDKNLNAVWNRFKNSEFIAYYERNYTGILDLVPNDPDYKASAAAAAVSRA